MGDETELGYAGYLILVDDATVPEDMQQRIVDALHDLEPTIAWEVRTTRAGEAVGTYGVDSGRLPQILGYSLAVPERIEVAIAGAWNRAIV